MGDRILGPKMEDAVDRSIVGRLEALLESVPLRIRERAERRVWNRVDRKWVFIPCWSRGSVTWVSKNETI